MNSIPAPADPRKPRPRTAQARAAGATVADFFAPDDWPEEPLDEDAEARAAADAATTETLRRLDQVMRHLRAVAPDGAHLAVVDREGRKLGGFYPDLAALAQDVVLMPWGDCRAAYLLACDHSPDLPDPWRRTELTATALRALWCDVDCRGPAHPGVAVTREEALAALHALAVAPTVLVDTGHGLQAWWMLAEPVPLPDAAARAEAKALLGAWTAALRAAGVPADPGAGKDLARLLRLAGTWNEKPGCEAVPAELVTAEGPRHALADLKAFAATAPATGTTAGAGGPGSGTSWRSYGPTPEAVLALAEAPVPKGEQSELRASCSAALAASGMAESAIADALRPSPWACVGHDGGLPEREARYALAFVAKKRAEAAQTALRTAGEEVHAVRLSEVAPEKIEYLWRPWLMARKVMALYGDPDEGKTFAAVDMCARLTRGAEWPDGQPSTGAADVLYLTSEDGLGDTIVPRAIVAGANLERFHAVGAGDTSGMTLDTLGRLLEETNARLVVLDPLQTFLQGVDMFRANQTRPIMAKFIALAEQHNTTILLLGHMTKGAADRAKYRMQGSIDIIGACRFAMMAGHRPDNEERHVLIPTKLNLGKKPRALGYTLGDSGVVGYEDVGRITWTGAEDVSAAEALQPDAPPDAEARSRGQAVEFLRGALANGPRLARDVYSEAAGHGIAERTLKRAKIDVGVCARQPTIPGPWIWSLAAPARGPLSH